jgi:hypothetical protein
LVESYGRLPLSFETNRGQTDSQVKFLSRGSGYSLFLTGNEAVLALRNRVEMANDKRQMAKSGRRPFRLAHQGSADLFSKSVAFPALLPTAEQFRETFAAREETPVPSPESQAQAPAVFRMKLVGANPHAKVTGLEELPGKSNYFIGNDPKKWRTKVPNYAKVKYKDVYPGVDLVYYGNEGQLEYDFLVAPGADPRQIALDLGTALAPSKGTDKRYPLRIDPNGELVVGTDGGEVIFHKPVVYQRRADNGQMTKHQGQKSEDEDFLDAHYVLRGIRVTFEVADYDKTRPVVIDPVLVYSTYLGGSDEDLGIGIAVDALGNGYVTGYTYSSDFPTTPGAFQTTFRGRSGCNIGLTGFSTDAFVSKLNAAGSALVYSTYLGGSNGCEGLGTGMGIAVDASGNAYVSGSTSSSDFPTTPGAFQTTFAPGYENVFITKLNAAGSALPYSTYLGGGGEEGVFQPEGIAVDASGAAYVTGWTSSSNFPTTPGAFQTTFSGESGDSDAFITKLNATGSAVVYSTYLGEIDVGGFAPGGIALDALGNAYVTGSTSSSNFPTTPGAFQTTYGGGLVDGFITKLNAAGSTLLYSTYLGGNGDDWSTGIATDASGNAYVTGTTSSSDFPTTPGALQTTFGGYADVFITKLNAAGSAVAYSTYLETDAIGWFGGIALDALDNVYVTGFAESNFPTTPGAFQINCEGLCAFVSKLNAAGSALLYSTYLGGGYDDYGDGLAVEPFGNAYVTGWTGSSNFPTTPGAFQRTYAGGPFDAFVAKFSFGIPFSGFSGKLELDLNAGSFDLNAAFKLGAGGSINPPIQPVNLTIGTYSVTIPPGSFAAQKQGYAFQGVVNGVSMQVLIKSGGASGSYTFLAEGKGANLIGTTNPVTVTLSIGNNTGTTQINAEFQ